MRLEKPQLFNLIGKYIKSQTSKLLQIIKSFDQYENLIEIIIMKKFRIFNIEFFPKLKIEKSCNSIVLMRIQVLMGSNFEKSFVYYRFYNKGINLKIVNLFSFLKVVSNLLSLIFLDIIINITFLFKTLFTTQYMLFFRAIY